MKDWQFNLLISMLCFLFGENLFVRCFVAFVFALLALRVVDKG